MKIVKDQATLIKEKNLDFRLKSKSEIKKYSMNNNITSYRKIDYNVDGDLNRNFVEYNSTQVSERDSNRQILWNKKPLKSRFTFAEDTDEEAISIDEEEENKIRDLLLRYSFTKVLKIDDIYITD